MGVKKKGSKKKKGCFEWNSKMFLNTTLWQVNYKTFLFFKKTVSVEWISFQHFFKIRSEFYRYFYHFDLAEELMRKYLFFICCLRCWRKIRKFRFFVFWLYCTMDAISHWKNALQLIDIYHLILQSEPALWEEFFF